MSSWHQTRNPPALQALWTPDPVRWKCVSDKHNQFASSMCFEAEDQARAYAQKTGDVVIPPVTTAPKEAA